MPDDKRRGLRRSKEVIERMDQALQAAVAEAKTLADTPQRPRRPSWDVPPTPATEHTCWPRTDEEVDAELLSIVTDEVYVDRESPVRDKQRRSPLEVTPPSSAPFNSDNDDTTEQYYGRRQDADASDETCEPPAARKKLILLRQFAKILILFRQVALDPALLVRV